MPTSATACTIQGNTLPVDNGCVLDYSPNVTVTIERSVILETAALGHSYTIRAKALTVRGRLVAQGGTLTLQTTGGAFRVENVQNSGRLDVRQGGKLSIVAAGDVSLGGVEVTADGVDAGAGGEIKASGVNVTVTSDTHANGQGGEGGYIELTGTGNVSIGGVLSVTGSSVTGPAPGGTISIKAGGTLGVSQSLVATGGHDGDGGTIELIAAGAAILSNGYHADGMGGDGLANGGRIWIEAGSVGLLGGMLSATGNAGAEGGEVIVRTLAGALNMGAASSISVDSGATGGGQGGSVLLEAATDATIAGPIHANAGDADSSGGDIRIRAAGKLTVSGSLEAISSATDGARNGTIMLGPACEVVVSSRVNTRNGPQGCDPNARAGGNTIVYGKQLTLTGSSLLADNVAVNSGGNTVLCACLDADHDGACDAPACAQGFSQTGATINPAPVVEQTLPASCS